MMFDPQRGIAGYSSTFERMAADHYGTERYRFRCLGEVDQTFPAVGSSEMDDVMVINIQPIDTVIVSLQFFAQMDRHSVHFQT